MPTPGDAEVRRADDARLAEIIEVVVSIASMDFGRRATLGDGSHLLDGLAAGVNMLAEELAQRVAREEAFQRHAAQNERLIAIGQLAAGVAHEVNNPAAFALANLDALEAALGRLATVVRGPEGEAAIRRAREAHRDAVEGLERIIGIARDLRGFSRLEGEQRAVHELADIIADAVKLVRAEILYRARLEVDVPAGLLVRGDRVRLAQVFTNLLFNAAQAIPEGATTSHLVAVRAGGDGAMVALTVRDTGSGVPAQVQARLFEPFFTTKGRDRGLGLGLAISADIINHHGGELALAATGATGSTFTVRLPRASATPAAHPAALVAPRPDPRRPRVLVVDDERLLLDAYARVLDHEFDLAAVDGGGAAISLLGADGDWDAVLCDVMMPDVDGVAVHDWVRDHRPALLPRLIFCTGGAFTPRTLAFTERKGVRLLHKPIGLRELRAVVKEVGRPLLQA